MDNVVLGIDLSKTFCSLAGIDGTGAVDLSLIFHPAVTRFLSSFTPFGAG